MNPDLERKHLAQANRHIAEVKRHIAFQQSRVAKLKLTNQPSEMAVSLLETFEESLRVFERHRQLILAMLQRHS